MMCVCGCDKDDHYESSLADWQPCRICDCESFESRLAVVQPVPEQLRLPGIDWDKYEVKKWT